MDGWMEEKEEEEEGKKSRTTRETKQFPLVHLVSIIVPRSDSVFTIETNTRFRFRPVISIHSDG